MAQSIPIFRRLDIVRRLRLSPSPASLSDLIPVYDEKLESIHSYLKRIEECCEEMGTTPEAVKHLIPDLFASTKKFTVTSKNMDDWDLFKEKLILIFDPYLQQKAFEDLVLLEFDGDIAEFARKLAIIVERAFPDEPQTREEFVGAAFLRRMPPAILRHLHDDEPFNVMVARALRMQARLQREEERFDQENIPQVIPAPVPQPQRVGQPSSSRMTCREELYFEDTEYYPPDVHDCHCCSRSIVVDDQIPVQRFHTTPTRSQQRSRNPPMVDCPEDISNCLYPNTSRSAPGSSLVNRTPRRTFEPDRGPISMTFEPDRVHMSTNAEHDRVSMRTPQYSTPRRPRSSFRERHRDSYDSIVGSKPSVPTTNDKSGKKSKCVLRCFGF